MSIGNLESLTSRSEFRNMMTRSPGRRFPTAEAISFVFVAVSRLVVSLSRNVFGGGCGGSEVMCAVLVDELVVGTKGAESEA